MILDVSDKAFKQIFNDENLYLPHRWDGTDFSNSLGKLFNDYIKRIEMFVDGEKYHKDIHINVSEIRKVTKGIIASVDYYLNGFPHKAYSRFSRALNVLVKTPLRVYQKSIFEDFRAFKDFYQNDLNLFRVARVSDNKPYTRCRVFHTPFNLRSKVSTCRYSIAGYPSLYLGTSLELCCAELNINPFNDLALASLFRFERSIEMINTNIRVIELGIKPQDFLDIRSENKNYNTDLLDSSSVKSAYLLWYPLIAACSFIRTNKNDPFAAEYIIPQLLMQWVRNELDTDDKHNIDQLLGIRYFSCASIKASNLGFNYVFPTSGKQKTKDLPYCSVLTKAFRLSNPVYLHEYDSLYSSEDHLKNSRDVDFIK